MILPEPRLGSAEEIIDLADEGLQQWPVICGGGLGEDAERSGGCMTERGREFFPEQIPFVARSSDDGDLSVDRRQIFEQAFRRPVHDQIELLLQEREEFSVLG